MTSSVNQIDDVHLCNQASRDYAALLLVVLTFLLCHSFRWVLSVMVMITNIVYRLMAKLYQVVILDDYLEETRVSLCTLAGRYPIPALWFCMADLNSVLIVTNSSLNFYIYCLMGKRFRAELLSFIRSLRVRVRLLRSSRTHASVMV